MTKTSSKAKLALSCYDRWFGGEPPQVGDWVGMKINDGVTVTLGTTVCRFVEWDYIRFLSDVPDLVM